MSQKFTAALIQAVKPPQTGQTEVWDSLVPGLRLRASYGGRKAWTVRYRVGGVLRRMNLDPYPQLSLADARTQAREIVSRAAKGHDPAAEKKAQRKAETFAELAQLYLDRHATPQKRASSAYADKRTIERDLLPAWRVRKATDIKRSDVIAMLDRIADRGAPVMADRVRALVSKIYNFGVARGLVEHNPVMGVPKRGQEIRRNRVLGDDEIRAVWKALDRQDAKAAAAFRLALLTAQRRSEVLGMRWSEIDLGRAVWTIPAERSKNKQPHLVPLGPMAVAILKERKGEAKDHPFVFPGGRKCEPVGEIKKWIAEIRKASKVEFRFHDLRRTAATRIASAGADRETVARILNHALAGVTAIYDRYARDREKRAALLAWERALKRIFDKRAERARVVAIVAR